MTSQRIISQNTARAAAALNDHIAALADQFGIAPPRDLTPAERRDRGVAEMARLDGLATFLGDLRLKVAGLTEEDVPDLFSDVDPKAMTTLAEAGYTDVGSIARASDKDLNAIHGIGKATITALRVATQAAYDLGAVQLEEGETFADGTVVPAPPPEEDDADGDPSATGDANLPMDTVRDSTGATLGPDGNPIEIGAPAQTMVTDATDSAQAETQLGQRADALPPGPGGTPSPTTGPSATDSDPLGLDP